LGNIIDLSRTIEDNLPVFPGDSPTRLFQSRFLASDMYNDHRLEIGMHAGTHIDGPMHLTESTEYISDLPVDSFIGNGCLLDARGQTLIGIRPEYEEKVEENSIVLLYTGWDKLFGQPEYFTKYPVIGMDLCQLLIRKHIKMVGLDSPSPDNAPYTIHKSLMDNHICVIENLTNLDKLFGHPDFEVIALPLNIKANGSPARVVARIEEA
jgi:kynurenine formamidase